MRKGNKKEGMKWSILVILRKFWEALFPSCCSVVELCQTLCHSMDCSAPGFPVLQYFPEFAQTHVH